jgi:hypothetical protein
MSDDFDAHRRVILGTLETIGRGVSDLRADITKANLDAGKFSERTEIRIGILETCMKEVERRVRELEASSSKLGEHSRLASALVALVMSGIVAAVSRAVWR